MRKETNFYRNIFAIAIPIALQNLITLGTSLMDTVMLGRADSTGVLLSASSLANQPFFILQILTFGIASGSSVLCPNIGARANWRRSETFSPSYSSLPSVSA